VASVGIPAKYVLHMEKAVHWQNLQFGGELCNRPNKGLTRPKPQSHSALGRLLSVIAAGQVRNCSQAKTEIMPHGILRRLQLIRDDGVRSSSGLSVGG
jgi:hypothetical protein